MKESNTFVDNATIKQNLKIILLSTKGQSMRKSSIPAGTVAKNFLRREILLNMKGQSMMEAETLVSNVIIKHFLGKSC